ncbi:hypothetical protein QFC19_004932 [Naganishia cerealis]|uniref:Uncharacterized protein n=1 Tax=Naganishia cerealis TaxID=610337 RepID=A0ACC2VRN5_9TREE|nr:hypothetical protein QFC19_004932 [Naganishia cerealis]
MKPDTTLPPYGDDTMKPELEHLEFGSKEHIDIREAIVTVFPETDENGNPVEPIDQAASNRLARKIDLHIVPILALQYLFAFIDRANIGNARIAGLERDLKLTGNQYNILLSRLFPGIAYYFGRWYRREEITFRMGLYIACAPLAGGVGGLLASGILKIDGIGQVHTWQQIFLIEGIITTVIGIAAYFLMSDRPETARWLSEDEKKLAARRLKADQVGSSVLLEQMNIRAVKQGIFATTTLVNGFIFLLSNITVTGVAFFAPTIVKTIYPTKSTIQQQLYTVPPYILSTACTCLIPYLSTRVKRRGIVMLCTAPLMIIGYIIFVSTTNATARYGALFLILAGAPSFGAFTNGWAAMNVASDTARAAALGCVVMMGNCGGLISTWSFMPSDGPNYPQSHTRCRLSLYAPVDALSSIGNFLNLATNSTIFLATAYLLWFIQNNNKKREAGKYDHYLDAVQPEEAYKLGNNHPGFRYKT